MAGVWYMIVPQLAEYTNLCTNPSFETGTTGWTALNSVIGQTENILTHGRYCLTCTSAASADGVYYGPVALTISTNYTASLDILGETGHEYQLYVADTTGNLIGSANTFTASSSAHWQREYVTIACATSDNYRLYIAHNQSDGGNRFEIDGVSIIATTAELTYFDGDTPNCRWSGLAHGSTSVVSAQARNVGVVTDLQDYNLRVLTMDGVGTPDAAHHVNQYAMMPGAEYKGHKVMPRSLLLTSAVYGTSLANLHSKRKSLINLLKHDLVANDKPIVLRYTGANASRPVELTCYLDKEAGTFNQQKVQNIAIRLIAYDPYFYDIYDSSYLGGRNSSGTYGYFICKRNGAWSSISATADSPATGVRIRDMAIRGGYTTLSGYSFNGIPVSQTTNEKLYVSGYFLNFGGQADADYIGYYDFGASAWAPLQAGTDGYVRSMDIAPDGTIYACGEFTQIGSATADRIAAWSGASWDVMGTGFGNTAHDVLVGNDGKVYACGNDSTIGGVANAAYVAYWDGSAWNAMSTGLDAYGVCLEKDTAGNIYIGGTQTGYVSKWDGSTITNLAVPGSFVACYSLKSDPRGLLYAGLNSATADYVYSYNGQSWKQLGRISAGAGGSSTIYSIDIDADGLVWIGGDFTMADDLTVQGLVCWNGSNFVHPDVQFPASTIVWKVLCNGNDVYIGYDQTGTVYYSYVNTATNNGTARTYPLVEITRTGGTSAQLRHLKNVNTGAVLHFNYDLQSGESVYIDLRESGRSIISSYYGNIWRAMLRGSDFADFFLMPGSNTIEAFMYEVGIAHNDNQDTMEYPPRDD